MRVGDDYYRQKAEECEERAREALGPRARTEWLKMAEDWRAMLSSQRSQPAND